MDGTSKVWDLIFMADRGNEANFIYHASIKSIIVAICILEAETFVFPNSYDSAFEIQHELKEALGKTLKLIVVTDS